MPRRMDEAKQATFKPNGTLAKPVSFAMTYGERDVFCPYCLYESQVREFMTLKLKSGKPSEKRFMCPDCKTIMRRKTLTEEQSIEEYAKWVYFIALYDSSRYAIKWDKLKKRLYDKGWANEFWRAFRKAKKEYISQLGEEREAQWQDYEERMREATDI